MLIQSLGVVEPASSRLVKAGEVVGHKGVGLLALLVRSNSWATDRSRDRDGIYRLSGLAPEGAQKVEDASSAANQAAFREDGWKAALKAGHAQVWQAEAG